MNDGAGAEFAPAFFVLESWKGENWNAKEKHGNYDFRHMLLGRSMCEGDCIVMEKRIWYN